MDLGVQGLVHASKREGTSIMPAMGPHLQAEVAWLVRRCNPEAALDEEQIDLIVKEVRFSCARALMDISFDNLRSLKVLCMCRYGRPIPSMSARKVFRPKAC